MLRLLAIAALLALPACETTKGLGQDISNTGDAITNAF